MPARPPTTRAANWCSPSCRRTATSSRSPATSASSSADSKAPRPTNSSDIVLPFPSQEVDPVPRPRAAPAHRVRARPRAARHGHRPGPRRRGVGVGAAAARQPAGRAHGPRARPEARRRHRHAAPGRNARGRGLHAPGPGRRARRVLHPRGRRRHLPGRRRPARPHRARRRHDRGHPPLRARHAAIGGDRRERAAESCVPAAASVGRRSETGPGSAARAVLRLPRHRAPARSSWRPSPTRSASAIEKQLAQISESYEQAHRPRRSSGGASPKPARCLVRRRRAFPPESILHQLARHRAPARRRAVLEELGLDDVGALPRNSPDADPTQPGPQPEPSPRAPNRRVPNPESPPSPPCPSPAASPTGSPK